ncbi:MAG: GNAT family N-acetyltransferase [Rhizobiales bacterium]|nr:GNAT family N-acetyltransferase [Hyphomicrobiales bacterium]
MLIATRYQTRMAIPGRDEGVLARLKVDCWREAYPSLLPKALLDGLDVRRAHLEWHRALGEGIAWIAEQSGEAAGFGHVRGDEVTTLYVRRQDHGRGVGCELLLHLFDEISCLGHRRARLWVLENNYKARAFYARMGGTASGRRPVGFPRWPDIMEVRYDFLLDQ